MGRASPCRQVGEFPERGTLPDLAPVAKLASRIGGPSSVRPWIGEVHMSNCIRFAIAAFCLGSFAFLSGCGASGGTAAAPVPCPDGNCPGALQCVAGICVFLASDAGSLGDGGGASAGDCVAAKCANEIAGCKGICADWWSCQAKCAVTDSACTGACAAKLSGQVEATQQAAPVVQCWSTNYAACVPVPDASSGAETSGDASGGSDAISGGCKSNADCKGGTCLQKTGQCVACTTPGQCAADQVCLSHNCVPATSCTSDKQCAGLNAVCSYASQGSEFFQVCQDCKSDADCAADEDCDGGVCAPQAPKCSGSKDCAPYGQVCYAYHCVDCQSPADCAPGFLCKGNVCTPKPKICTPEKSTCMGLYAVSQCSSDGTSEKTTSCKGDQECSVTNGVASCGLSCCQKHDANCGEIAECPYECGDCSKGDKCIANKCTPPAPKLGLGAACNESPQCPFPGPSAGQTKINEFFYCLSQLCKSEICVDNAFCSATCTPAADEDGDGVEDAGVKSDCTGAVNGPAGTAFRCIRQSYSSQNYPNLCVPGTTMQKCTVDSDCPAGEACGAFSILDSTQKRCTTKLKQANGAPGVVGPGFCDTTNQGGKGAVLCANGLCFSGLGCVNFCNTDADCAGFKATSLCISGHCGKLPGGSTCSGASCAGPWKCKESLMYSDFSTKICLQ